MTTDFDAIVVGSGISGGWACKELCEKGLKVLLLERGRDIQHGKDYVTEHMPPWKIPYGGLPPRELYADEYPIQSQSFAFDETTRHFFNNDKENPYHFDENNPFIWTRANGMGGRSLLWSRQVYRWSDLDFEANKRDGHGIDWPIRYKDIAPWYSHVEKFVGVSGEKRGWAHLPDGEFQPPMALNIVERALQASIEKDFPGRSLTIGRVAIQTEAKNNRGVCHYCGPCERGCSVGAYFSSLSSTLPAARASGNLTVRADSVVDKLLYDADSKRVSAVSVIDANTGQRQRISARMVFLCASTIASTQILLNSRSEAMPNGLANSSGTLGHYLMDHTDASGAFGLMSGYRDKFPIGNRPNGFYIPRFRNIDARSSVDEFLRGYGYQGAALRVDWRALHNQIAGFGKRFKQALRTPGPWVVFLAGFGEHLPRFENRMYLHANKVDRFGIPQVAFEVKY
jgi:choline dehydrogenase-like flavoprotein